MLFKDITYIDENFNAVEHAYVGTKNGVIDYISTEKTDWGYGEVYDGRGKVLIPGLVNNHTHAAMTLMRGYGEDLPLQRWLEEKIFPFEAQWDENSIYWAGMLAMAEMMACGTTSFTDMYFFDKVAAKVVKESGMKSNFSNPPVGTDGTPLKKMAYFAETFEELQKYCRTKGRFIHEFGLHAEYSSCESLVRETAAFAKENNLRIHAHMSEPKPEPEECQPRHGLTPALYFEKCGLFENPTNVAHCVWVEDEDIECLARNHVTVTHCPSSNMKLGSGFAPVRKMLDAGINVALGTDGASSNNNLNMFEEMHLAAMIARGKSGNAGELSPKEIFKMATVNGAISQGRLDTGVIKKGNRADLAVVDFNRPHLVPCHDVLANLVFSAQGSDVVLTMVDGDVIYRDGKYKTVDINKVYDKISYYLPKILEKI